MGRSHSRHRSREKSRQAKRNRMTGQQLNEIRDVKLAKTERFRAEYDSGASRPRTPSAQDNSRGHRAVRSPGYTEGE